MNYHVRFLMKRDLPDVMTIIAATADPITEALLLGMLRQRTIWGWVVERHNIIVGLMVFELRTDDFRLIRLDVKPDNPGADRALWLHMENKLEPHGRTYITVPGGFRVPCRTAVAKPAANEKAVTTDEPNYE